MKLKRFRLIRINLDMLDGHKAQPNGRDDESKTGDLRDAIEASELCVPPTVTPKGERFEIIDGHRRVAVLRAIGVSSAQCNVVDASAKGRTTLFAFANNFTRPVNGNERIQHWALTPRNEREDVLGAMKRGQSRQIKDLELLVGEARAVELSKQGFALASLGRCVRAIVSWCEAYGFQRPNNDLIVMWIVGQKAARLVDSIARNGSRKSKAAVINAILDNRSFAGERR